MFADLAINLAASLIYDFGIGIKNKAAKKETVQSVLRHLGVSSSLHDFPERYVEALVELRFSGKEKVVMDFFREESIMQVFFNYYYGTEQQRGNDDLHATDMAHYVTALKVGDDVIAANVDVGTEVDYFWSVFRQKVQESRTLKEVEVEQELKRLRETTKSVQEMMTQFLGWMKAQGKEAVELKGQTLNIKDATSQVLLQQVAEKVFNIDKIQEAHFHIYGDRKIPHPLTPLPFRPETFVGREREMADIHQKLFADSGQFLLLVNGNGGMGKTTLASHYFHQHHHEYRHVAWVLSEKSIADALLLLAPALGLEFPPTANQELRLQLLVRAMAGLDSPCLLVIDNANETKDLIDYSQWLRQCSNFHLLITTRTIEYTWAENYRIEGLPADQALDLFEKYYRPLPPDERDLFAQIREAVGGNTLVLELLAKNLKALNPIRQHYRLADLLSDLQQKGLLQLTQSKAVRTDYQSREGKMRHETPEAIIAAMYDLGDLPEGEVALLSIFAVLPAERIAFEVLETLLPEMPGLEDDLTSLTQKGWIEYNDATLDFKCSPVVQQVVKKKNVERLRADCGGLVSALIDKLDYEAGTGHFLNASYEEALLFSRYAEAVIAAFSVPDTSLSALSEYIGSYYQTTGDLGKAFIYFEKESEMGKALLADVPNSADYKNRLAISYSKLGETHTSLGNLPEALQFFEERSRLGKELYEAYPDNVGFKNGLAVSYSKLGETHTSLGNLPEALQFFEERSRLGKELYEAYPENVGFKNGLAISNQFLGNTHVKLGNLEKALNYYEDYNSLEKELYESYPENVSFKNNLASSYSKLGETHTSQGNLPEALQFFEDFSKLMKELYKAYPENVGFKNGLAISYEKLGDTHTSLGNLEKALQFFEDYNRLEKELYEAYPENVGFKNGLAISYEKLGDTHTSLGNLSEALQFFEDYNRLEKELYESYPENVEFKNGLAISYQFLGNTHVKLGNLEKALNYYEDYNSLGKELYESYPENVGFKNSLAISYAKLGLFYKEQKGDTAKAKAYFQQCHDMWKELTEAFPAYVEFQRNFKIIKKELEDLE